MNCYLRLVVVIFKTFENQIFFNIFWYIQHGQLTYYRSKQYAERKYIEAFFFKNLTGHEKQA